MKSFTPVSQKRMLVRVLYHDHCFDGAASAAFFSRFIRGAFHPDAGFKYTGMAHRASQIFEKANNLGQRRDLNVRKPVEAFLTGAVAENEMRRAASTQQR